MNKSEVLSNIVHFQSEISDIKLKIDDLSNKFDKKKENNITRKDYGDLKMDYMKSRKIMVH